MWIGFPSIITSKQPSQESTRASASQHTVQRDTTMARGAEAKLRRRNRKKTANDEVTDMFADDNDDASGDDDDANNFPPFHGGGAVVEDDNDNAFAQSNNMPKKKKKISGSKSKAGGASDLPPGFGGNKSGGIKSTPLILLILMVGTTILPALIYAGDYLSAFMSKSDVMGSLGFRLGIGSVPKKRVVSFYEKHAPEKLDDVPGILAKHYGKYPTLIKKLERKYQDYGYFVGWEEDEAPIRIAMENLKASYDVWIQQYWNRYAPQILKTAARNVRYNLTFLYKKITKIWKKQLWPVLQPYLGVPDAKAAAAQKRKDAADARARAPKKSGSGTRRKNTAFRDDDED